MSGAPGASAEILAFTTARRADARQRRPQRLQIDLPELLATRMLIQAASGGGKSYALRRLLEQTQASCSRS